MDTDSQVTAARGVFWIVEGALMSFPYRGDDVGAAKSGNTYNHKKLWPHIKPAGCGKPFDYYPRGRVEITNKGRPVIWLNPNIEDEWLPLIKADFGIEGDMTVRYDFSTITNAILIDEAFFT